MAEDLQNQKNLNKEIDSTISKKERVSEQDQKALNLQQALITKIQDYTSSVDDLLNLKRKTVDVEKNIVSELRKADTLASQLNTREATNNQLAKDKAKALAAQTRAASLLDKTKLKLFEPAQQKIAADIVNANKTIFRIKKDIEAKEEKLADLLARGASSDSAKVKNLQKEISDTDALLETEYDILTTAEKTLGTYSKTLQTRIKERISAEMIADISEDIVNSIEEEEKLRKRISKTLGATGAVLEGLNSIAQKLGLTNLQNDIEQSQKDIKTKLEKNITDLDNKDIGVLKKMLRDVRDVTSEVGKLGVSLLKEVLNPVNLVLLAVGKIGQAFLKLDDAATEFGRLTGRNGKLIANQNFGLATGAEVLETMAILSKDLGRNAAAIFSPEELGYITEVAKGLGLSADETAKMAKLSKLSGRSINDMTDSVVSQVNAYNKSNKELISHGQVLRDVYNVNDDIAQILGNNPARIAGAAAAARRLGLDLNRVDEIAGSLLDFESSINAELEAQLLTGGQINLGKARELALANDLEGLSNELANNNALMNTYSGANRVQQEAMAKALGMSRSELSNMVGQQLLLKGATDEELKKATGMTKEQLLQITAQEKFNTLVDKLAQAFAPILDIVHPILDVMIMIGKPISYLIQGLTTIGHRTKEWLESTGPIQTMYETISNFGKSMKGSIDGFFGNNEKDGGGGMFGQGGGDMMSNMLKGGGGLAALFGLKKLGAGKLLGKAGKMLGMGGNAMKDVVVKGGAMLVRVVKGGMPDMTDSMNRKARRSKPTYDKKAGRFRDPSTGKFAKAPKAGGMKGGLKGLFGKGGMKGLGKGAMGLGKGLLRKAGPLAALAFGAYDAFQGFNADPTADFGGKLKNAGSSVLSGLTFGMLGKDPSEIATEATPMAKGGIVTSATNAVVGEAGPEAVIPLKEMYAKFDEMIEAFKENRDVYMDTAKVTAATAMNNYRR